MGALGLIVAAARSGSGKTTVALALACMMRARGLRVRVAKAGPDYIDPAFHAAATGAPCPNLDGWAMPPALLDGLMAELAAAADLVIVETAMGLFDGVDAPPGRSGAGAELAARFGLPVLLVLDVSGQSQSAAAVALGMATFDGRLRLAGAVLNRVGSQRHRDGVSRALAARGIAVLGSLGRDGALALPERHLGLVQAEEHGDLPGLFARLAAADLDGDAILAAARPVRVPGGEAAGTRLRPPGQRVAVARDAAFSFLYPHVMAGWRAAGAEVVPFSPLADEPPAPGCDAVWLPGGYPELHAGRLAAAARFRTGMAAAAQRGPVHGECGGHMALGRALIDADGAAHPMLGLLSHVTSFRQRRLHLGYREAVLLADGALGRAGEAVRGHEFHSASTAEPGDDPPLARLSDAAGQELAEGGSRRGPVTGSFFHAIAPA